MEQEKQEQKVVREQDFLFDKSYTCPVCGKNFKALTVRSGKMRMVGSDPDLRPRYGQLDAVKYDVVLCPHCGYTALARFFDHIVSVQVKAVKELISARFTPQDWGKELYTYDDALKRYQMAYLNASVKKAKAGEMAYICLKTAWILRGKAESLNPESQGSEKIKKECGAKEEEFLRKALDGFIDARQSEPFPICGMDQYTLDYLIAALALRFEQYDVTSRMLSGVLQSSDNLRLKNRAADLKEELRAKMAKENS